MSDEFFVGYLPTPPGIRSFSLAVAAALLLGAAGVAWGAASFQRSPGASDRGKAELTGLYLAAPYGHLRWLDEGGEVRHTLLTVQRKFGARDHAAFDGQTVTIKGLLLERDDQQLLELSAAPEPARLPPQEAMALKVDPEPLGEVTVSGEIVDSKCYMGRMRPGNERAHRACAQLCVRGGIPPVLISRRPGAAAEHYLLAGPGGAPINQEVLPWVAEPVRITGALSRVGDLQILELDPETIERL
jgi:hypothetical protein